MNLKATAAWHRWAAPLGVFAWTFAVFIPALSCGFVDWDDGVYIVANPHIRGFNGGNLAWMLTTFNIGHFIPVTWLSFALDYSIWGLNPQGYHLTNVLLHALNALLFFFISKELLGRAWNAPSVDGKRLDLCAAASALLFAIHPLRVESVAWAFERKDVLCGFFYLAAVLAYLRSHEATTRRHVVWSLLSLGAFALSLLSKAMAVTLPLSLIILDIYPLRRYRGIATIREKIPYFLLSLAAAAVTWFSHLRLGATMRLENYGIAMRAAQIAFGLSFYLQKTLLPVGLSPRYLHPSMDPLDWRYLIRGGAIVFATATLWRKRRTWTGALAAWLFYIITVAPVAGIIPQSSQIAADRYTYLPCLSWALCAGAILAALLKGKSQARRIVSLTATAGIVIVLSGMTVRQLGYWRNSQTLWRRATETSPQDPLSHDALGRALASQNHREEAMKEFRAALDINPSYANAQNDLGALLASEGRIEEAISHFREALRADPTHASAADNLQRALRLRQRR